MHGLDHLHNGQEKAVIGHYSKTDMFSTIITNKSGSGMFVKLTLNFVVLSMNSFIDARC